jgi:MYXO-CTERM domain-containing protein
LLLTSDSLSPVLWPLAVLGGYVHRRRRHVVWIALLMAWTVAAWWLLTHRVDRFLVPLLPLVALLAGLGARWRDTRTWRRIAAALLTGAAVYGFLFDTSGLIGDNRFLVSLRDEGYDIQRAPQVARRYLNEHVQPGYQALLVGEAQVWDIEVPMLYNTCFDDCQFELLMRDRSREERLAVLRERRISHIYFSWYELDRYRSPGNYGYSDYVTRERVRDELAREQGLIRRVPIELEPESGEVYEVVGWQAWE